MPQRRLSIWCLVLVLGALLACQWSERANAQSAELCSDLEVVFEDGSGTASVAPAVITVDASGAAHLVWLYKRDKENRDTWSLSYARWQGGTWSEPNDILVTPGGGAGVPRIAATPDGQLHVVWLNSAQLWHSAAPVQRAGDARAWSHPAMLASDSLYADLTTDSNGALHVVYTTGQPTAPVYHRTSQDGSSWSTPSLVYGFAPATEGSGWVRISVGSGGRIHVTWDQAELPNGWPVTGQFYSKSEDGGLTWADAFQVGAGEQGQGAVLAIGDDEVHLVWRGSSGAGSTYHQWSLDGGSSWEGPNVFDPDGGFSGPQTLGADSAGRLHLVRSDGGYQRWNGLRWSPVPALFWDSGEPATMAIGLGNQLHWVNTSSEAGAVATIWHRVCQTGSAAVEARVLPEPESGTRATVPAVEGTAAAAGTTDMPGAPAVSAFDRNPPERSGGGTASYLGLALTAILMAFVVVFYLILRRKD